MDVVAPRLHDMKNKGPWLCDGMWHDCRRSGREHNAAWWSAEHITRCWKGGDTVLLVCGRRTQYRSALPSSPASQIHRLTTRSGGITTRCSLTPLACWTPIPGRRLHVSARYLARTSRSGKWMPISGHGTGHFCRFLHECERRTRFLPARFPLKPRRPWKGCVECPMTGFYLKGQSVENLVLPVPQASSEFWPFMVPSALDHWLIYPHDGRTK